METDKRPLYLKWMLLIINIIPVLIILTSYVSFLLQRISSSSIVSRPMITGFFIIGPTLLISVLPVLISTSNSKSKNIFGYGIPLLMLLIVFYAIWHASVCTGKMCSLGDAALITFLTPSLVIFTFFYILGSNIKKWTEKTYRNLFILEIVILLCLYFLPLMLFMYKKSISINR